MRDHRLRLLLHLASSVVALIAAFGAHRAVVYAQSPPAPGGFVEAATSGALRAPVTVAEAAAFLPARGAFTFPAPYNTTGLRLTNADDCGGRDCVRPVGYSYWSNINNHAGSDTMLIFLGLERTRGGGGPTLFSVNKVTGDTRKVGPIFPADHPLSWNSGEGWYFSRSRAHTLYVHYGSRLLRYDVQARTFETVFDVAARFGASRYIWQVHSSADDRVHSFTLRDSVSAAVLGCVAYQESPAQWLFVPRVGAFDECQVDKSGRWLVIKEDVDGRDGEDNRVIDLQTGTERVLLDAAGAGGHSDLGFGYMVAADNFNPRPGAVRTWRFDLDLRGGQPVASVPGQGTLVYQTTTWSAGGSRHIAHGNARAGAGPEQQVACSSGASRQNLPRANEIVCFRLDGSGDTLVVAPNLTSLDAAGGGADEYNKLPKGNLDPTGEFFVWTANVGSGRLDAFLVRVPTALLGPSVGGRGLTPDAPLQLVATAGAGSATLSWRQAATGAAAVSYRVVVGTSSGSSNLGTFDVGSHTSVSGTLAPGRYYACVVAVNARGTSAPSNEVVFTVSGTAVAPGAPRNLAASSSGSTLSLAWLPPASGGAVSSYALRVGSASGLSDIYSGSIGAGTSFAAVVPSRRYFIRVVALNASGASAASNEVRVDVAAACALPAAPALSVSRSGSQVTAAWSVPSGGSPLTHYVVRAGRTSGGADLFNGSVGLTNRASAALSRGTYFIRVAAATACGVGTPSAEAAVVVP